MPLKHSIRSYCGTVRQSTFDQTTDPSLPPKPCRSGFDALAPNRSASIRNHFSENGYNDRFNGTLCWEVLNAEWFTTTKQAQVVINYWFNQYNHTRSHQALNMRSPVPETSLEKPQISGTETGARHMGSHLTGKLACACQLSGWGNQLRSLSSNARSARLFKTVRS